MDSRRSGRAQRALCSIAVAGVATTAFTSLTAPVRVLAGSTTTTVVGAGDTDSLLLKSDGTLRAWGDNAQGQLGNGGTANSDMPITVPGMSGVTAVSAGLWHDMALEPDGSVWTWGDGSSGQLGNNSLSNSSTPAAVANLAGITAISAGGAHSMALKSDGTVWTWGDNVSGQLGNGSQIGSSTPVNVSALSGVTAIAAGVNHSLALKSDGTVWAWGDNGLGQVGTTSTCAASPCAVTTPTVVSGLTGVVAIAAGGNQSLALKSDGSVWVWGGGTGGNGFGQTGTTNAMPVQAPGISGAVAIAAGDGASLVLKSDGTVWYWGNLNVTVSLYVPGPAAGPIEGVAVGSGATLPTQVPVLKNVSAIAAGTDHALAVESDGSVWAWGGNANGQLGNGTTTSSPVPVQAFIQGPPQGGSVAPQEISAVANAAEPGAAGSQGTAGRGVDTATGVYAETTTDLSIPGRSQPLAATRTYSSTAAATDAGLGHGWSFGYGASLSVSGSPPSQVATVTQEDGSTVSFLQPASGNTWAPAAPRVIATLSWDPASSTWTLVRDNRDHFTFDSSGELTRIQDPNGYATTLAYSGGHLATATDEAGRTLSFTWSATTPAHLVQVTDANVSPSRTVLYGYNDGAGNLTDVTGVDGSTVSYTYDSNHMLLTAVDQRGNTWTNDYDASGRVDWQKDQLGHTTSFAYSWSGATTPTLATTTVTDPAGNATVDQYQFGLLSSRTRGAGTADAGTWNYLYDTATLARVAMSDPDGHATGYTVDQYARVTSVTDPMNRIQRRSYDSLNDVLTDQDGNGVTTTYTYDAHGNLTQSSRPLTTTNPPATRLITWHHADAAHPGDVTSMLDGDGKTWSYGYDAYGDRTSTTDPLGDVTTSAYNADGLMTSSVSGRGNVAGCGCAAAYTTTYTYDAAGRQTSVTDPLGHTTRRHYDAAGNLDFTQDATQSASTCTVPPPGGADPCTVYTYDKANQPTTVTRADGTTQVTEYNADGTVRDVKDGRGFTVDSFVYDHQARLAGVTDALGRTTGYGYDAAGNRTSQRDPLPGATCTGNLVGCTTWSYDGDNEVTAISYSDGSTPSVTGVQYDNDGQRIALTTAQALNQLWTWDSLHRMTGYHDALGDAVAYGYDMRNDLTAITYPGNHLVSNGYDDAGRWTSVSDWNGNTTTFGYDANSNLTSETLPSGTGVVDTTAFDAANRVSNTTVTAGGSPVAPFPMAYTRDANGRVTSDSGQPAAQSSYAYTTLGQLCYAAASNTAACSTPPSGAQPYGYDGAGNLGNMNGIAQQFDSADQLCWTVSGTSSTSCGGVPPANSTVYTYDLRGDRSTAVQPNATVTHYGYDQARRLTSYASGSTTAAYVYDGTGLRTTKVAGSNLSQYVWSPQGNVPLILRDGSSSNPVYYIWGPGNLPLEQISAPPAISLVGSPSTASDSSGTATTLTMQMPPTIAAGDQVLVATTFPAGTANDVTTPAGYTLVATNNSGGTAATADVTKVFRHTAAGNELTVTLCYTGVFAKAAVAVVYRGADAKVPVEAVALGATASGTVVSASTATRYPNDQLVLFQGASYTSATAGAWTAPTGMTEQAQKDAGAATIGLADRPFPTPGATGAISSQFTTAGSFTVPPQLTAVLVALRTPPATVFLHHDQRGSTRLLTDITGAVAATYSYDPWGNLVAQAAPQTASTPLLFAGQYRDAESGLYAMPGGDYDPGTAQWLTRDAAAAQTLLPYAFAGDDPLDAGAGRRT